ncbi:MAG: hypothetical protein M5U26_24460 [Planctomycetota bacterium]|nr:hypothetical protein [Planctomycetota bacterium]
MPKQKKVVKLPPVESVPSVKPITEQIGEWKKKLAAAKEKAVKDGKVNKYDPKLRTALKKLKRAQRKLRRELFIHRPRGKAAEAPAT